MTKRIVAFLVVVNFHQSRCLAELTSNVIIITATNLIVNINAILMFVMEK